MVERSVNVGSFKYTVQDLHPRDGIRWAVGAIDAKRSSTWRLWGDKKGDVYLAMRSLGGQLKVSIHRDRRCSVGFTKEFESEAKERFGTNSRHWERWTLPDAPVVKAAQILVPDSELAAFPAKESDPMAWIPPSGEGRATVFTLFVAEPAGEFQWESPETSGNLLGTMICKTRSSWLVHTSQLLDEPTLKMIDEGRMRAATMATSQTTASQLATTDPEGLRMVLVGHGASKSDLFFVETDAFELVASGKLGKAQHAHPTAR